MANKDEVQLSSTIAGYCSSTSPLYYPITPGPPDDSTLFSKSNKEATLKHKAKNTRKDEQTEGTNVVKKKEKKEKKHTNRLTASQINV